MSSPIRFNDPLGLFYGDGVLQFEDVLFGPMYWANEQMGWDPSLDQSTLDFGSGFGDAVTLGLTGLGRDALGLGGYVNKCSSAYSAGEWTGIAASLATGVAGGVRAAGTKGAGREFSHWIPNRMGGPRSIWNGNFVSREVHALSDPYRYRFMSRLWKSENPMPSVLNQQWVRLPNAYKGAGAGASYGAAGAALSGCECEK
jgi:hypothetical protein